MKPQTIGFIGLGHIGGSIAKTIRRIHADIQLIAFDTDRETVAAAMEDGVIDYGFSSIGREFAECDYIYLCAPVLDNNKYVELLSSILHDDMLLTDIGSVKTGIHDHINRFPELESHFIGGHPMCGTERSGYENANEYLLENAYYILTPTPKVAQEKVSEFKDFITSIGAIPVILGYEEHDYVVGSVSHLPTVIAATLVNLIKNIDDDEETMRMLAAGGFKDITRVASSSPVMWENICLANRDVLIKLIDKYVDALESTKDLIGSSDGTAIEEFFSSSKEYRDSFNTAHRGSVARVHQLFCDLIDEAGGIATIATILATNNINIKNIGIVHNREFQQGVLQVEFYDDESYQAAVKLLRRHHYTVYEK